MILVTGGTGTIGSATVAMLGKKGARFKVGTRSPDKVKGQNYEAVRFDWDDFSSYLPAFQGVEKIFLLTPVADRATGYTLQAIAAAKRAGVKHIVKLSVIGAESEPGISLSRMHLAAEKEMKASGIAWTMLRPTFFMQNFVNYYGADGKKDGQIFLAHDQQKVAFIDARDIGEVGATVLTSGGHEGKAYDLTGPEALTSAEAVRLMGDAFGRKYTYVAVPAEAANKAMVDQGSPLWLADGFGELDWLIRQGYASAVADGVKRVLDRAPRAFADFARDAAAGRS